MSTKEQIQIQKYLLVQTPFQIKRYIKFRENSYLALKIFFSRNLLHQK